MPRTPITPRCWRRLPRRQQLEFVDDFSAWLDDGYAPKRAAEVMLMHAKRHRLRLEAKLSGDVLNALKQGQPLQIALQRYLDNDLVMLFAVGEQAGCLSQLLENFKGLEHQQSEAIKQFWRPLLYPALMVLIAALIVFFVAQQLLPMMTKVTASPVNNWLTVLVETPPLTFVLVFAAAALMLTMLWGPMWWLRCTWLAPSWLRRHGWLQIAPAFAAIRFVQFLNLLVQHGCNLERAAALLMPWSPNWMNYYLKVTRRRLASGQQQLSDVLDNGLLSPRMLFRLSNSSIQGSLQNEHRALGNLAERASVDIARTLKRTQQFLMVVLYGTAVGLILLLVNGTGTVMMSAFDTPYF